jgi:hypothetical protein
MVGLSDNMPAGDEDNKQEGAQGARIRLRTG